MVTQTFDEMLRFKDRWTAILNSFNYSQVFFDESKLINRSNQDLIIYPHENAMIYGSTAINDGDEDDLELSTDLA